MNIRAVLYYSPWKLVLDTPTIKRLQDMQKLNVEDKNHVFAMMDAFLRDAKTKKAYSHK